MQYYQEALQQVCWAEQLGFHSVWFTEHHFSRPGIVPASLTVLAYLAGVTTSIRLGIAVAVLPFHNPIQLAEQKVLDSLELFATQVTPLFKD